MKTLYRYFGNLFGIPTPVIIAVMLAGAGFLTGLDAGNLKMAFGMAGLLFGTVIGVWGLIIGVFCLTVYVIGPAINLCLRGVGWCLGWAWRHRRAILAYGVLLLGYFWLPWWLAIVLWLLILCGPVLRTVAAGIFFWSEEQITKRQERMRSSRYDD